jgi:hypothetical protein
MCSAAERGSLEFISGTITERKSATHSQNGGAYVEDISRSDLALDFPTTRQGEER